MIRRRKRIALLGLVILITACVVFRNELFDFSENITIRLFARNKTSVTIPNGFKKILYWNTFFDDKYFNFGVGVKPFIDNNCNVNNCYLTDDKYSQSVADFDAIIFHAWDFKVYGNNPKSCSKLRSKVINVPEKRNPFQRYVFYYQEPPGIHKADLYSFDNFFNLTFTYRIDSDVFRPYGYFAPINSTPSADGIDANITWEFAGKNATVGKNLLNEVKNKTNLVAWTVSNCNTASKRHLYVRELQKFVQVDVYGKCGNFKCPTKSVSECYKMIQAKYKFYLSFENSVCKDYVTEKFFEISRHNVVPIVYGGAEYDKIAPPNSYINIEDYDSPRDLARYLLYLHENDEEYAKYFWWKKKYKVVTNTFNSWCKLCAILNSPDYPNKSYNIHEWFQGNNICRKPQWEFVIENSGIILHSTKILILATITTLLWN